MTKKMPEAPKPTPGDKKFGRSAVTNGKLIDGDMRSKAARRLRDLIRDFSDELGGGDLSPVEAMLVRNAAMSAMKSEEQQAKMAAGEDVSDEDAVRVGNMCSRAARDLASAKAKRGAADKGDTNTLDHVSARLAAERAAEPEDDDDDDDGDPAWLNLSHDEPVVQPAPEPVCTPSAPDPGAFMHAHVVPEPVKPQGPVAVWYDARPRSSAEQIEQPARTLHQVVGAIRALNVRNVRFTTPAVNYASIEVDGMIAEAGAVLADKCTWFVKGAA
jgi:hypothetical protein